MGRLVATGIMLLFAAGGFCGVADGNAGPLSPFGLLFLGLAWLIWRNWLVITGSFGPPHFYSLLARVVGTSMAGRRDRRQHDRDPG